MGRIGWWGVVLAAAAFLAACGGDGGDKRAAAPPAAIPPPCTRPAGVAAVDWNALEQYLPSDEQLPEHVVFQTKLDLSNEAAAKGDQGQLAQFQQTGRLTGIQAIFAVDAGARVVSVGVSYYDGCDAPRALLRRSGDPADVTGPNRFEVAGLGDEYIAQRLRLGSGEAVAHVINIAWVRGPFFVSLADLGGTPTTPTDIAVALARAIDERLKTNARP
jgi:hypothetical protein